MVSEVQGECVFSETVLLGLCDFTYSVPNPVKPQSLDESFIRCYGRLGHLGDSEWRTNAYIICTIDEIMDSIRCARQKAVKLLDELEHEYQLIERRRQGLGKPNLLYVKDLYAGLSQSNYWKYENQTSLGNIPAIRYLL